MKRKNNINKMLFSFCKAKIIQAVSLIITGVLIPVIFINADYDLDKVCGEEGWKQECSLVSEDECQSLLNQCQAYFNEKMQEVESDITKTAAEKQTLKKEIDALTKKLKDLDYQIYQSNLSIKSLGFQITDTEQSIVETTNEIEEQKRKIGLVIRAVNDEDQKSFIEILMSSNTISDFFDNLVYLQTLGEKNKDLLNDFEKLEAALKGQRINLEDQKGEQEGLLTLQTIQKQESTSTKQQKQQLQTLTEAQYQAQLKEKESLQAKKAEIEKRLIQLVGLVEGEAAPSFGEALDIAKSIGDAVGVRPAFLLAIISQESAIGKNVGQCYITDIKTGGGIYSSGKPVSRIMHATRDLPIFLNIISSTGRSLSKTPVSCWIPDCVSIYYGSYYHCKASVAADGSVVCARNGYTPYGFGGAMGPAQFIPSTWNIYDDKVADQTGKSTADPWNIKDSFTAAALYLKDLGGTKQSGEFRAASRYYGGSSAYANSVATRAWCIQDFINNGSMSDYCQGLIF